MAPQSTTTNGLFARALRLVDRRRDELLAAAGLAEDEHGEVGRSRLAAALEDGAHALADTDERSELRDLRDVDLLGLRSARS